MRCFKFRILIFWLSAMICFSCSRTKGSNAVNEANNKDSITEKVALSDTGLTKPTVDILKSDSELTLSELGQRYVLKFDNVDSIEVKLSRYSVKTNKQNPLMARSVFDYYFERIWEETGACERASYSKERLEIIKNFIQKSPIEGKTPDIFWSYKYRRDCIQAEYPLDDLNIVAKIKFFKDDELVNVLWCSHKYMDGMIEFNYPIRRSLSKDLKAEFDRIHKLCNRK